MNSFFPPDNDFTTCAIPFYTNLTSLFNRSIYAFESVESMNLFKRNNHKLTKQESLKLKSNGQFIGVPLFQCQLKQDASFIMSKEHNNLVIYKYIIVPNNEKDTTRQICMDQYLKDREYKLVCENSHHAVSIYKIVFSEIKNKKFFLSYTQERLYTLRFRNDNIKMTYFTFEDFVKVGNDFFKDAKWVYNNNFGGVLIDGMFLNNNYKLVGKDKSILCEFDDSDRSNKWVVTTLEEYMGILKLQNYNQPPAFSPSQKFRIHNNAFLSDFNEKIICMTFVLITHQKYNYKNSINRRGVIIINNSSMSSSNNNNFVLL